jgi:hypothetical protein
VSDHVVDAAVHEGDTRHPDHDSFLLELGRATFAAARLAVICFDILRVRKGVPGRDMYEDPLGTLKGRLTPLMRSSPVPGLADFVDQLKCARVARNDLLHALPVKDGLQRRKKDDPRYVRNLFTVADVQEVTAVLSAAHRTGSDVLYHDNGAAVRAWYEGGGT